MNRRITWFPLLTVIGLWLWALWANWRGWIPTWSLFVLAAAMILAMVLLARWHARRPEPEDALSPWREYYVIKSLTVQASTDRRCHLTLQLAQDLESAGTVVTLQFHGVTGIVFQQLFDDILSCGGLRCEDRGPDRRDGLRYQVQDRWRELIEFRCRSFEATRVPPSHRPE